jgi:SAM-dependent methyltransferase
MPSWRGRGNVARTTTASGRANLPTLRPGIQCNVPPVKLATRWLEWTVAYRLWMAPFAERKFAPILAHNDLGSGVDRVLDVGCGPGTNTRHFSGSSYLGLDINDRYVADARRRYGREFRAVDVTRYVAEASERADFILLNSFLHHVATLDARRILAHLSTLLTDDGHVHILDLVMPERRSVARRMAHWDRGAYARPLAEWRDLFQESFETVVFEPYRVGAVGITLWNMVYFKGRARRESVERASAASAHVSGTSSADD